MCCLLTLVDDPLKDNNFWNFRLGQISLVILASHAVVLRGARLSSLSTNLWGGMKDELP